MAAFSLENLFVDRAIIDIQYPDSLNFNEVKGEIVNKIQDIFPIYNVQPNNSISFTNPEKATNLSLSINRIGLDTEPDNINSFISSSKIIIEILLDLLKPTKIKRIGIRFFLIKQFRDMDEADKFLKSKLIKTSSLPKELKEAKHRTQLTFYIKKEYQVNIRLLSGAHQRINIKDSKIMQDIKIEGLIIDGDFFYENINVKKALEFINNVKNYIESDICYFLNYL
ncbi:TIGR04255 family protein [Candidatus Contubernalis alkaliaceticus]|uniref:TIGR04255 family protein n=1 Tax=Candidatus Contubernalis alkaliaceticus TaxID=338645 RepID=UPI001F4C4C62|nr:TIGR04255 family protein [Candidatus Contubernalis alkalaceticus]UNC91643.1 TIGR04255 family protein [Candidatus Contubernalis alkalaceticus]